MHYEQHVANLFIRLGYNVESTPLSHDFGVDLIVRISTTLNISIQCKYWVELVGVRAVQEVYSGNTFYGTNKAIVISNNDYTKNAQILAKKLYVLLIKILPTEYDITQFLDLLTKGFK